MSSNIFDRISFLSIFLTIVLLPLFFLPFTNIPIENSKSLLLVIGLAVTIISWGLARFFDGKITFPRSRTLLGGAAIVVAFLLSALFSKSIQTSLFGTMLDMGTFWFIFCGFLLMLMASIILKDPRRGKIVLFGAILSGAIVVIFQILHAFFPETLTLGVLAGKTDNVFGSWNSLGIFAGFSALMSLLVVEFFTTTKVEKLILQIFTILSVVMVAAVNFQFVWELLGISALVIFVYKVSLSSKERAAEGSPESIKVNFPVFSFVIILITLLFFMSGNFIGGLLPNSLGLSNNEISPTFSSTMSVTGKVIKENPILGVGPNKWSSAWAMYRPLAINTDPKCYNCWDVSFNSGSGLLPTLAATTGILGILALLFFFVLFIANGVKSIFSSIKNSANWETMAFFVLSFYLFIASFFYSTGPVLFLLALAFAGVFIGLSSSLHKKEITISYLNDHRQSFFSILFIVLILITTAGITFKYAERLVSVSYFSKAVLSPDIQVKQNSILKALSLHQNDLYLRTYAQIYLLQVDQLAAKSSLSDEDKSLLQSSSAEAVRGAQAAVSYDKTNYLNHLTLGSIYQKLALYGVKDAYVKAIEAYNAAQALNPYNPGIKLAMAYAAMVSNKNKEAKDFANAALALKGNYIDAFVTLSQIEKSEGDNATALSYAEKALAVSPTNPELIKFVDDIKKGTPTSLGTPTSKK